MRSLPATEHMAPPDTIVAIATPAGRGAIGIIRVSGPDVARIAVAVLGALPAPRTACLSSFLDADGATLDQGLALYFPAPASFTGEPVLELQGHGGMLVLDLVMRRLLALGCRAARAGEFSERAFLNGKMDMVQAEAVADLIDAGTTAAARGAVRSMQGEFSARVHDLQAQLTELRAYVEAAIDFSDEQIDFLSGAALNGRLSRVFSAFDSIKTATRHGALLREGLTVVIAGKPNAGKSSLMNRLAGDEVAIVTDLPGTTRDVLRQPVQLDGLPLHLVDTAGLRNALDIVEEEGIRRAKSEMQRADRILYVEDATLVPCAKRVGEPMATDVDPNARVDPSETSPELGLAEVTVLAPGVPITMVMNKIDLTGAVPHIEDTAGTTRVWLSAHTGAGFDLLCAHLRASVDFDSAQSGVFTARRRHLDALERAQASVQRASDTLAGQAFELFAEDLRLAQRALGEITGEFTSDDLLGKIFGSFCIGK